MSLPICQSAIKLTFMSYAYRNACQRGKQNRTAACIILYICMCVHVTLCAHVYMYTSTHIHVLHTHAHITFMSALTSLCA